MMRLLLLALSLVRLVYCIEWDSIAIRSEWSTGNSEDIHKSVLFTAVPSKLCLQDHLTVDWSLPAFDTNFEALKFVIQAPGIEEGVSVALGKLYQANDVAQKIHCQDGNIFCQPKMQSVNVLLDEGKVHINFDRNAILSNAISDPSNAFELVPSPQHTPIVIWINSTTVDIHLDSTDMAAIASAYAKGEPLKIDIKPFTSIDIDSYRTGQKTFRLTQTGSLNLYIVNGSSNHRVSPIQSVVVDDCTPLESDILFLPRPTRPNITRNSLLYLNSGKSVKQFSMDGVFPVTGLNSIKVTHAAAPAMADGAWSIEFWIRLLEAPTGQYRSIMFKGDTITQQRTPSAWLMPNSNHISLRVSTNETPDFEVVTSREIPINKWTHVAFTFNNQTVAKTPDDHSSIYESSVYINGKVDVSARFATPVQGNDSPLLLFYDGSFPASKGLIQGLYIWSNALHANEVENHYHRGPQGVKVVDRAIRWLTEGRSLLIPFLQPLAFDALITNNNDQDSHLAQMKIAYMQEALGESAILIADSDKMQPQQQLKKTNEKLFSFMALKSQQSITNCEPLSQRLDIHAESAELGSTDGLLNWANLMLFGYEVPLSKCGFAAISKDFQHLHSTASTKFANASNGDHQVSAFLQPYAAGVLSLIKAVSRGSSASITPLAITMLHETTFQAIMDTSNKDHWGLPVDKFNDDSNFLRLQAALNDTFMLSSNTNISPTLPSMIFSSLNPFKELGIGLLYLAAMHREVDAHVALSYRHEHGLDGIVHDIEAAVQYSLLPVKVTGDHFQLVGAQAIVEADRINDYTVRYIAKGHQGNDDEAIEFQRIRASEGDVPSMLAMGDLYYYGARGLPQDHGRALQYFEQAARAGDATGMCGAANMYLKGEGTSKNLSKAMALYENATSLDSIRALNGLGYLYFYGNAELSINQTKAFEYFLRAATFEKDGDSVFNTAYCYDQGIGTEKNLDRAVYFYTVGAKKLGNFGCVQALAIMTLEGRGVTRSSTEALTLLKAAKSIGPWASWMRRGFDLFLAAKDGIGKGAEVAFTRSLACYLYVAELGYEVAQSNAAYILRAKLIPHSQQVETSDELNQLLHRQYQLSGEVHGQTESCLQLGNFYFGKKNYIKAMTYYQRASQGHHPLASVYLGVMNHLGLGLTSGPNSVRAARYYELAMKSEQAMETQVKVLVTSLQAALAMKTWSYLSPLNMGVEYLIKMIWKL